MRKILNVFDFNNRGECGSKDEIRELLINMKPPEFHRNNSNLFTLFNKMITALIDTHNNNNCQKIRRLIVTVNPNISVKNF